MVAIGDEQKLYLLEFIGGKGVEREVEKLKSTSTITPKETPPLVSIKRELGLYFAGKLNHFKTSFLLQGSAFQKSVWEALLAIPCGQTCSYQELAHSIGRPTAVRAVANANGANQLAVIIPCHRVIQTNGGLGGYGGGVQRKQKLLELERDALLWK